MRNRCMFEKMAAGMALAAAVMAGAAMLPGSGHGLVINAYAADTSNQNSQNISGGGTSTEDKIDKTDSADSDMATSGNSDDGSGIYEFKDNKTTGTITITKKWDDGLTNAEREIPDMYLSTEKPSKSTKGYTVTFHGNGLTFADGTDENMVVYNSSGQIVEGSYKEAVGTGVAWYSDKTCKNRVEISDDGVPQVELAGDLDLWAKEMTFEIKGYSSGIKNNNGFNAAIPDTVTEVIFTDEVKPKEKEIIAVDADGDGGIVAWLDDDTGTVMKVSTQIPGVKVQAATDSENMFYSRSKLQKIDLKMLDTQNVIYMNNMFKCCADLSDLNVTSLNASNVINMDYMFAGCIKLKKIDCSSMDAKKVTSAINMFCYCENLSKLRLPTFSEKLEKINKQDPYAYVAPSGGGSRAYGMFEKCYELTDIDLAPLNTSNVTDMSYMFYDCFGLTSLDLTPLDTQKVANMEDMFAGCSGLTSLDLSPLDTQNVTNMGEMFYDCSGLTSLDLTPLDTKNVTYMYSMFYRCYSLTSLDLSPLDTQNVTSIYGMFRYCFGLTSLDLTSLDTSKVTNMSDMFYRCSGLKSLDLAPLDTQNVTNMSAMFSGCSGLTSLDLTPLNTQNVANMEDMFQDCSRLTSLDLTPLDTQNVTDMGGIFNGCSSLTSLDLTPLCTQKVTKMGYMFAGCSSLTSLDLTPLDTQNVTYISGMFAGCSGLTSLDLTPLDTQKVTNMWDMFSNCSSLTSLTTGTTFKFVGTNYTLSGTWQNTAGETFNGNYNTANFPSNVTDTYTKISS
ncbi:MAG: BspA family leucine-rich repeat surface protein [Lachnospiraceae bacterium]